MSKHTHDASTITVTAVADGLAYVRGRIVAAGTSQRWEYLGSHDSREAALSAARAESGGRLHIDEEAGTAASQEGIASTRPPADS